MRDREQEALNERAIDAAPYCPVCNGTGQNCATCGGEGLLGYEDIRKALLSEGKRGLEAGFAVGIRTACAFLRANGHDRLADSVACQAPVSTASVRRIHVHANGDADPSGHPPGESTERDADGEIKAQRDEAVGLLRSLEWSSRTFDGLRICPACGSPQNMGHMGDCRVGLFLTRVSR